MKKTVKIQSWLFTKSDSKFQIAEKYGYAPNRFSYLQLHTAMLLFGTKETLNVKSLKGVCQI